MPRRGARPVRWPSPGRPPRRGGTRAGRVARPGRAGRIGSHPPAERHPQPVEPGDRLVDRGLGGRDGEPSQPDGVEGRRRDPERAHHEIVRRRRKPRRVPVPTSAGARPRHGPSPGAARPGSGRSRFEEPVRVEGQELGEVVGQDEPVEQGRSIVEATRRAPAVAGELVVTDRAIAVVVDRRARRRGSPDDGTTARAGSG